MTTEATKPGRQRKAKAARNGYAPSTALVKRKSAVPYTNELAEIIFERLRGGETVADICKSKDMPAESTLRQWAAENSPFSVAYRRAREIGVEKMADDLLAIADAKDGDPQWARLQIDSRKFLLAKILPTVYGERIEVKNTGGLVVIKLDAGDLAL